MNSLFARGAACAALALAATAGAQTITFKPVVGGLASPVDLRHGYDNSGRLYIVEQAGRIRVTRAGVLYDAPFLDITTLVKSTGGEEGLLGLAFHPQYPITGHFYVYHTAPPLGGGAGNDIVLARYRAVAATDVADPDSRLELLRIPHPGFENHNGGGLAFGRDGLLYVSVGDGGSGGDPSNNAQDLGDLRGKVLRIDVDSATPYAIPPNNPFVDQPGAHAEIFAYGLRNPWRLTFDRINGDLFVGDVGQDLWEEIDFVPAGAAGGQNFGWRVFEGTHCYNPPTGCALAGHVPPILEYPHSQDVGGYSVSGGFRYRGHNFPELAGAYVYADYVTGRVWIARPDAFGTWNAEQSASLFHISSFGEDRDGEMYAVQHSTGNIFRIGPQDADDDGMSDGFEVAFFADVTAGKPEDDLDNDSVPNLQEYREGLNPHSKDNDVFTVARLFAMQQYRDFLGREGDVLGTEFWASAVDNSMPRSTVIQNFLGSGEFEGAVAPVVRLYFAYFLRIPDYPGLDFWLKYLRAGGTIGQVSDFFSASPEFQAAYGSLDNAQFVALLYNNVLGRAPDGEGLAFWTGQLDGGLMSRGQVMIGFSESAEYRADIAAEVYVTMAYAGMLRRTPDAGGFSFWVDFLDTGNPGTSLIEGFLGAPEYRARFLPL